MATAPDPGHSNSPRVILWVMLVVLVAGFVILGLGLGYHWYSWALIAAVLVPATVLLFRRRSRFAVSPPGSQPQAPPVPRSSYPAYPSGGLAPQNTMAILGFVLSFVVAIAGVVCSHIALSQIKHTGERGRGLAIAGLVIGYVGIALSIAYVTFIVALLSA